ncbi:MAG: peptidylprolyl isomerase [Microcystis sp.]
MSFNDVTDKYIQDKELRRQGGYLGVQRRQDLKPEISAAVFATKPPQLLKPIVKAKGISLILVEEIIQPELDYKLRFQILSDLFSGWLKHQIEDQTNFELSN